VDGSIEDCLRLIAPLPDGLVGIMKKPTNDRIEDERSIETFHFRNLHPKILIGTASDRYAGWIGQGKTQKEIQKFFETGITKEVFHRDRLKRLRETGLPTKIQL
jgi:hypothetical protein